MTGHRRTRIERTPSGRRLVVSRPIDAVRDRVWDVFTDTRQWPRWGPSITAVETDQRYIQDGATGRIKTVAGVWLPFEITHCADYRWTWDVARLPATGHWVRARGDGCIAAFEVPLLASAYAPVCWRALGALEAIVGES